MAGAAAAIGAAGGLAAMTGFSGVRGSSRWAGGLTATVPAGGATTTTGRAGAAAVAGALAMTGPAGGREAMAGGAGGGATMGGAERGCGTTSLRGSGCCGATTGFAGAGGTATGADAFATGVAAVGRTGRCTCRASSSSSFFLARMAFITSPGLEMCERSIFGVMAWAVRDDAAPACVAGRSPPPKCARTFSASSSSSELECVLPAPRPISFRTSRIWRLFRSNSRARSLIRILLIRLFSTCCQ